MVRVNADTPALTVKFGALVVDPPAVEPKYTAAVLTMFLVKPPVPVQVKPVAVGIYNIGVPPKVEVSAMFPAPNATARVLVLDELKSPVLRVNPARSSVPCVNCVELLDPTVKLLPSVTVIPLPLIVMELIVLLEPVIIPLARNVGKTAVYVPRLPKVKLPQAL